MHACLCAGSERHAAMISSLTCCLLLQCNNSCAAYNTWACTAAAHSEGLEVQMHPRTCASCPAQQRTPACSRPLGCPPCWPVARPAPCLLLLQPRSPLSVCTAQSRGRLLLPAAAGTTGCAAGKRDGSWSAHMAGQSAGDDVRHNIYGHHRGK